MKQDVPTPNQLAMDEKISAPETTEKLLVSFNAKHHVIDERSPDHRFDMRRIIDLLPPTVTDLRTLRAAEIINLYRTVDHTFSRVGATRLFLAMLDPSFSLDQIQSRQEVIRELSSNKQLYAALQSFLTEFSRNETDLFGFLNAHTDPMIAYEDYRRAVVAIKSMVTAAKDLPRPVSSYLSELIDNILRFQDESLWDILAVQAYRTFAGIKSHRERSFFTPSWRFRPRHVDFGSLWPSLPAIYFGMAWLFGIMEPTIAKTLFLSTSWLSAIGLAYGWLLKPLIDFDTAILPIRQMLLESDSFIKAIESVALLDELTSLVAFMEEMPHPMVLPTVTDGASHHFMAKGVCNPIIALKDRNFVANEVNLANQNITFITGPNSGGKTTYCKSIVQNQILAQIGSPVVATEATINIADLIIYQAPNFDSLADEEGRFGTELKTTRDIFYQVSPKSLAILDEIAEGTTTHEKLSFSTDIMHCFHAIGNSTLLVTHSYELVDYFQQMNKGSFLKISFFDDLPSHKITEGISHDSNAERVAKKIGFSRQDMLDYLKKKGYQIEVDW
ncbi:MAG: hypothetical protein KJ950_15240 [Proteobacteria bacterium]|nr:hypothetical protein [Pseudomonadota bacterium]MBU1686879.1 hypothetical protein [Pseudomonadota bacterium]